MRIAQKQEILNCLSSLKQAHEEIRESFNRNPKTVKEGLNRNPESIRGGLESCGKSQIQSMLSQCQEFAVFLGEIIEKFEGEGHITVTYLEEYCETLFQVYEETEADRINTNKVYKLLRQQLAKIENSARNDISVRKEVVFLPYKASMWDSMESVWMAADKDQNCDAYVVVIPYYEKNPDGSLGQMHYEGNEYPDNVPVTDWQTYSLENRMPDVVYIQNPYDDCNYVTCVHPQYFSANLKKYTGLLVYLPYFVGVGDYVEEHFCTAPGVANADRVIVQSEEVKKIYIESIRKFEKENHCEGRFGRLKEKIQPLGSPKMDRLRKVLGSGKADIPEEWKNRIYRPDGKKKKIVLYNTTIDALLKHTDTYMGKLKSVLHVFRQEEDIVLLWRPHPLLVVAIKSMRPELYKEYMEIVGKYREEKWGIYDETADIDRAIVLSDAYYGDMSSLVELYRVTGKPIMIQDCEILSG